MKLSETIKNLRLEKGWSQQTLATKAKLSYNTITKIEQGVATHPTIQTIIKLTDAFDVSIDDLVK